MFNDILKCMVTWTDNDVSIATTTDINAIGARIDQYTFDTGDGEAVLSCIIWGDDAPNQVTWTNEDGNVNAQADKVKPMKNSFTYLWHMVYSAYKY